MAGAALTFKGSYSGVSSAVSGKGDRAKNDMNRTGPSAADESAQVETNMPRSLLLISLRRRPCMQ